MEKKEFIPLASEYFDLYPNAETLFITADGMVFLEDKISEARTHANKEFQGELYVFKRSDVEKEIVEEIPTSKWKLADIRNWLTNKGTSITADAKKEELLSIVATVVSAQKTQESETPTLEWEEEKIKEWLVAKNVEIPEGATKEDLIAIVENLNA